jgi:hypothetical protein
MRKLLAYLLSFFTLLSCQNDPPDDYGESDSVIRYEVDNDENAFDSLEGSTPFARLAATSKGKVTFEYLSNEGEIVTTQWSTITLWYYGTTQPTPGDNSRFTKPKYIIRHPGNNRSYTRKSMSAGWYMLQLDEDRFAVMNVAEGSDGLFVWNDQNFTHPFFSGYFGNYGKVKFTFGRATATAKVPAVSTKAQAFLTFSQNGSSLQFWLYNDRSTGSATRSQFWFVPTGIFDASWYGTNLAGDADTKTYPTKTGVVTIAPGRVYPNIKL